jgi:hypothetical protein
LDKLRASVCSVGTLLLCALLLCALKRKSPAPVRVSAETLDIQNARRMRAHRLAPAGGAFSRPGGQDSEHLRRSLPRPR